MLKPKMAENQTAAATRRRWCILPSLQFHGRLFFFRRYFRVSFDVRYSNFAQMLHSFLD